MSDDSIFYYGSGSGPCIRAMIAIHEKGLCDDEKFKEKFCKLISFDKKEHKSEDVLKLNKRGQVPTMKLQGAVINESSAICDYVELQYKNQGTELIPLQDKAKCAKVLQRKAELESNLGQLPAKYILFYLRASPEERETDGFKNEWKEKMDGLRTELGHWENYLKEENGYAAGDSFTMVDVFLMTILIIFERFGMNMAKFTNLKAYYDKTKVRPSIQKSWPPHWKEGEAKIKMLKDL